MSKPLLLSIGNGKVQELVGTAESQVPVWDATTSEWHASAVPGGGGGGGVTSVGLTGGTSGIVIGGTASPITETGTYELNAPHKFAFDTTAPEAPTAPGQMSWNATEGSLNTLMVGGNVDAIVGQQLYQRVVNADSVTLTKGMVVYVFGSSGTRVNVKRAIATADLTSATILGVVAESIAQNAEGFVITNGLLKALSALPSTTFTDGVPVYLSPTTPGGLTPTKPTAPQHLVLVGYCVKASNGAAGVLLVHPQNGYELSELHDVAISSPTSGQILVYDATSGQTRWENASLGSGDGIVVTPGPGSLSVALDPNYAPTFLGLALSDLTASQFVKTDASKNLVSQQYVSLSSEITDILGATHGGTAQSTWATGDMLYASAANTLAKRTIGSAGDVLTVSGGVPTWAPPATSGTVTSVSTVAINMGLTLTTVNGTTTPTITLAGTLAASKGGTGKDLSAASGIVAVLSGEFSAREIGNGDIASNAEIVRSKLATGTAHAIVVNDGSGRLSSAAALSNGQLLIGSTGAAPVAATLSQGTGVTVTNGAGSIQIGIGQSVATTDSPSFTGMTLSGMTTAGFVKNSTAGVLSGGNNITTADVGGLSTTYAPLASPTFTGTPSLPTGTIGVTQTAGNNTTALATTAFTTTAVANAVGSPDDLSGDAYGALASGQTIFRFLAPRNLTLTALTAAGGAAVKVQVAGSDVTLPGTVSVTTSQLITVLTTASGTDAYFTITGKVA